MLDSALESITPTSHVFLSPKHVSDKVELESLVDHGWGYCDGAEFWYIQVHGDFFAEQNQIDPITTREKEDGWFQGSRGVGEVWGSLNLVLHRPAGTHSRGGHTIYYLTLYRTAHLTPSRSNSKAYEWNNCSCWDSLFPPFQSQHAIYCWNA